MSGFVGVWGPNHTKASSRYQSMAWLPHPRTIGGWGVGGRLSRSQQQQDPQTLLLPNATLTTNGSDVHSSAS